MAAAATALANLAANIFSMFGPDSAQWAQNALANLLNQLTFGYGYGLNRFQESGDPFRDAALRGTMDPLLMLLGQGEGGFLSNLGDQLFYNQSPETILQLYRDSGQFMTPQMEDAFGGLLAGATELRPTANLAAQVFAGGGWTPQYQQAYDLGFPLVSGMTPEMATLSNLGMEGLNLRGQTAYGMNLRDVASGILNAQGRTAGLNALRDTGSQTLAGSFGVGGLTPTGAAGEAVGLEGLLQEGRTPYTDYGQNLAAELFGREAVLPFDLAVSQAREEALTQGRSAAERLYQQALARGGGPGNIVASGTQNRAIADFSDIIAEKVAQATRDAAQRQQQLMLQERGLGAQALQQMAALENARLGTFGDVLGRLEDVASRRFGIGGTMMSDAERLAAQRELGFGQLGLDASRDEIARMQLANDILGRYLGTQTGALGIVGDIMGRQNQYALGAGNLLGSLGNIQGDLYSQLLRGQIDAGTLGMNRATNILGAQNQLFGRQMDYNRLLQDIMSGGRSALGAIAGQGMDLARTALGGIPTMADAFQRAGQQPTNQESFMGRLPRIIGGAINDIRGGQQ